MNWGVLEGDCHRVPRPTRQQQGTQRTQQKTSHQQQTKSARWFFCSTENVINSFHLVVISTIHLWRYTFGCTTLEKLCFQGTGCGLWPWLLQSFLDFGRSCLQCSFRSPPRSCSVELHSRQSLCHLWNNLKLSMNGRRTVLRVPCEIEKNRFEANNHVKIEQHCRFPFWQVFVHKSCRPKMLLCLRRNSFLIKPLVGYFRVCLLFAMNPWSLFDHFLITFDHFLITFCVLFKGFYEFYHCGYRKTSHMRARWAAASVTLGDPIWDSLVVPSVSFKLAQPVQPKFHHLICIQNVK